MSDIFDQAYSAAQKAAGAEKWEKVSDAERLRAIREQICKMDSGSVQTQPPLDNRQLAPSGLSRSAPVGPGSCGACQWR